MLLWDERSSEYVVLAQGGHRLRTTPEIPGFGYAMQSRSAALTGPGSNWTSPEPWLVQRGPMPLRGFRGEVDWNQSQEFLSVDFFELPPAAPESSPTPEKFANSSWWQP